MFSYTPGGGQDGRQSTIWQYIQNGLDTTNGPTSSDPNASGDPLAAPPITQQNLQILQNNFLQCAQATNAIGLAFKAIFG